MAMISTTRAPAKAGVRLLSVDARLSPHVVLLDQNVVSLVEKRESSVDWRPDQETGHGWLPSSWTSQRDGSSGAVVR